ncbi:TPA: phosphate transport system regulatory protein PhoU [bacterium]|nr:phosphate transport system regulatory protein PhoU [bacterium]
MERHFDEELRELEEQLLRMGALVGEMISLSIKALAQRETGLITVVREKEDEVNRLHIKIDELCLRLLALRQPLAVDLRFITAGLRINSDLERMGDLAVNITDATRPLLEEPPLKPLIDIPRMSEMAANMAKESLNSFLKRDTKLAKAILNQDNEVDYLKDQIFREFLTYMMQDSSTIKRALELILISRHLERIADHACNIAEDVIFMVMGKDIRHPKLQR